MCCAFTGVSAEEGDDIDIIPYKRMQTGSSQGLLLLSSHVSPDIHQRPIMPEGVRYPTNARYRLNWLKTPDNVTLLVIPNNGDAAFKTSTSKPKPSDILLHYNYGAAAIEWWGQGVDFLQNRSNPPRPPVPVQVEMGPPRTKHDRAITINDVGTEAGDMMDSEGQAQWDEDDVMLFLQGNSKALKDRSLKRKEKSTQRMEQWRKGASQVSV